MEYTLELDLCLNEERTRPEKEVRDIVRLIFDDYNCSASNIRVKTDGCEHDWRINGMKVINTDGIIYNEPCYRVKDLCTKCGKVKYEEE